MDEAERRSRVAACCARRERRDNVDAWVDAFLDARGGGPRLLAPFSDADFTAWLSATS